MPESSVNRVPSPSRDAKHYSFPPARALHPAARLGNRWVRARRPPARPVNTPERRFRLAPHHCLRAARPRLPGFLSTLLPGTSAAEAGARFHSARARSRRPRGLWSHVSGHRGLLAIAGATKVVHEHPEQGRAYSRSSGVLGQRTQHQVVSTHSRAQKDSCDCGRRHSCLLDKPSTGREKFASAPTVRNCITTTTLHSRQQSNFSGRTSHVCDR